jgi:tetratricopeptide (TPR) repeat protein
MGPEGTNSSIRIVRAMCALLFVIAAIFSAKAAENPGGFEHANKFYEQGNYAHAIAEYEALAKQGRISPELLFNLGNAYFKNGDLGRAIASYRRAERLNPRDPDIQANLGFARDAVPGTLSLHRRVPERLINYFTANELALAAAILLWVWLGLLALRQWRPQLRSSLRVYIWMAGTAFALVAVWLALGYRSSHRQTAIIVAEQAPARFGPLEESQVAYTASDGAELRFLDTKDRWLHVSDRTGRLGWIKRDQAALFP